MYFATDAKVSANWTRHTTATAAAAETTPHPLWVATAGRRYRARVGRQEAEKRIFGDFCVRNRCQFKAGKKYILLLYKGRKDAVFLWPVATAARERI